jgi:2-succinyl-5-enolpyruvyl-6-hydroxy-3-cyclohexene-1-carboxylate synthase
MSFYASQTTVSSEKSRAEIEATLRRYGADSFAYVSERTRAIVAFQACGGRVKFELPMPDPLADDFSRTPARRTRRSPQQQRAAWEQACRQKWRALTLCVKAKLEAVESGITTFESEFMAHILLPDGRTVGEHASPMIERAYTTGTTPPLLGNF